MDHSITTEFKQIGQKIVSCRDNKIEGIRRLGNTLLSIQQMSSGQEMHIVSCLCLYSASRRTIFMNID